MLLLLLLPAWGALADSESFVRTPLGDVQGITTAHTREFRGVPFAEDPLRWQRARAIHKFSEDVLLATEQPPACPQITDGCSNATLIPCPAVISEACLRMNIITPRLGTPGEPLKSVFVFFHGGESATAFRGQFARCVVRHLPLGGSLLDAFMIAGSFNQGFAAQYNGTEFASRTDIIIVIPQYRLGALGFLHVDRPNAQIAAGGLGIFDQQIALEFVQQNIGYFGGDPAKVTVGGQR